MKGKRGVYRARIPAVRLEIVDVPKSASQEKDRTPAHKPPAKAKPHAVPNFAPSVAPRTPPVPLEKAERFLKPLCSKDARREALQHVRHTPPAGEAVATDGRILGVVFTAHDAKGEPSPERYPNYMQVIPGYRPGELPDVADGGYGFAYPVDTARMKDELSRIAAREKARVTEINADTPSYNKYLRARFDMGKVFPILVADAEGALHVKMPPPSSLTTRGETPCYTPAEGETFLGMFTHTYLKRVTDFMERLGDSPVTMHAKSESFTNPCVFTGGSGYAVLMPVPAVQAVSRPAASPTTPQQTSKPEPKATSTPAPVSDMERETEASPAPEPAESRGTDDIQDFGEKIGGARKDMQPSVSRQLSDSEIAGMTLSEIWPKPEVDAIEDAGMAALATVLRNEIPSKPRVKNRVRAWVEKVNTIRSLMLIAESAGVDAVLERMESNHLLRGVAVKVDIYKSVPREQWGRIGSIDTNFNAYKYDDNHTLVPNPYTRVEIDKHTGIVLGGKEKLISRIQEILSEKAVSERTMPVEIRGRKHGGRGGYFINRKGDPLLRKLKVFDTGNPDEDLNAARDFMRNHMDELVAAWEAVKDAENVRETDARRDTNRPRAAADYRGGKDVTPESFMETFGFRGVEFGNWVSQGKGGKERQGMLNEAYDALMDLASIVGVPSKAISLNGELAIGFGSRGHGKASAHYEPDRIVINLTKPRGAGALAHEWFHALDHYFQRQRNESGIVGREGDYITQNPEPYYQHTNGMRLPESRFKKLREGSTGSRLYSTNDWTRVDGGVRPEVSRVFVDLVKSLNASPMAKRAERIDKGQSGGYWSRVIERAARSFENYVIFKMQKHGYHNDYLANVTRIEDFQRDAGVYPYLLDAELEPVADAFDILFGTIQTRETERGVVMFRRALTDEAREQMEAVAGAHTAMDGERLASWMKAPNGKPTRLTEEQWLQVRTPNFKAWFGDWENDPENASKVLDENGEPLVVYHGTNAYEKTWNRWDEKSNSDVYDYTSFTVFQNKGGNFFNADIDNAGGYGSTVYHVFLNLCNPLVIDGAGQNYSEIKFKRKTLDTYGWAQHAKHNGYDGVVFKNIHDGVDYGALQNALDEYVAFSPNQIKSATDNDGSYSGSPDIRFRRDDEDAQSAWDATLDSYEAGTLDRATPAMVSASTPPVLLAAGADDRPITIAPGVLDKVTGGKHTMTLGELRKLPVELCDPIAIFNSATVPDSLVVLTTMLEGGRNSIVALHLDAKRGNTTINSIASIHGRPAFNLQGWIGDGLLLYANKQKIRALPYSRGLQLPKDRISRGHRFLTEKDFRPEQLRMLDDHGADVNAAPDPEPDPVPAAAFTPPSPPRFRRSDEALVALGLFDDPPIESDSAGHRVTGITNAYVREERERLGLPDLPEYDTFTDQTAIDSGLAAHRADSTAGRRLVDSVNRSPRALSKHEAGLMAVYHNSLDAQLAEAERVLNEATDRDNHADAEAAAETRKTILRA